MLSSVLSKRQRVGSTLLLISLSLALSGCQKQAQASSAQAAYQHAATPVTTVTLKSQNIPLTTMLSGRLSALYTAEVRPQIAGIIQKRLFKEGSQVKAGQLLYQVDDATYRATYEQATGTLLQAQAQLQAAKSKAFRYSKLVKIKAVSEQDYDDAMASVAEYQGLVKTDQGALASALIDLQHCRISAPISGWIGSSSVTPGALITDAQTTALATIYNYDQMYLDVTRSSNQWLQLHQALSKGKLSGKQQAKVKVILADGSTYQHLGTLLFSGIDVDATTGSITLRIQIPNPQHLLLPGMFVSATLNDGLSPNVFLVPQLAVQRASNGQASVWTVVNGRAHKVVVQIERAYQGDWVINQGIKAGEQVITQGFSHLVEGAPVAVAKSGQGA
ncbi:efflux RND transporter periplasmic adaptor subunit [Celerinatantimonas yamalensis]|uniref:Efflux RND transporter periplasmic adaptor subunit n=1 Tax=Celerinatantimonas yamalensis TaxID=559956 RepID=A0ABW9G563_9GAMM